MKNLILSLFVLVSVFGFSQVNIDSTLSMDKDENFGTVFYVRCTDMYKLKEKSNTSNLDSLTHLKSKKLKNVVCYLSFSYCTITLYQFWTKTRKEGQSEKELRRGGHYLFFENEIKDSSMNIVFVNGSKYDIYTKIIQTSENTYGVVMTYKSLNGKEKTYFSNNCTMKTRKF